MVAAINAGLQQQLFSLIPGDNRWPAPIERGSRGPYVFPFEFDGIAPALCCVTDIVYDEISIHVALRPTKDGAQRVMAWGAGFLAGDATADGWLERRNGAYLQTSPRQFKCRKSLLPILARANVEPLGFVDHGRVVL
jgi:hypothetical protein